MRALLPVSVMDIRGPALGETATSILNYFNLIVYLISNALLKISEDMLALLEVALSKRPFLSLLLTRTPTARAFIQQVSKSAMKLRKTKVISILLDAELFFDAWTVQPDLPLRLAIEKRNTALAKRLIEAGADLTDDRGCVALSIAARKGDLELVSFLIEMRVNPNPPDASTCYPALLEATARNDEEMVRFLLNFGADIDASFSRGNYVSPLVSAAENGDLQLVQLLLDRGAHTEDRHRSQETALGIAADRGHSELARELLDAGASVHPPAFNPLEPKYAENSALYEAVAKGYQSVVELLLTHKADPNTREYRMDDPDATGMTALFTAVTNQNKQIVQILLKAGARVNEMNFYKFEKLGCPYEYRKETALHQAVRSSNTGLVQILLNAGAIAIQLRPGSEYQDNISNNTANLLVQYPNSEIAGLLCNADPSAILKYETYFFQSAIQSNNSDLARFLLNVGFDANGVLTTFIQGTALQYAVSAGNFELVKLLLDYGADVNAPPGGNHGRTALQSAAERGSIELVQILLNHGADIHVFGTMEYGTALQLAAQAGHVEVVKLLLHSIEIRDSQINVSNHYSNSDTASNAWKSTTLPAAAKGGLFGIVKLLLTEGADVNTVPPGTRYGTALQEAIGQQDLKMVHLLLDNGADPNIPGPVRAKLFKEWRTGTPLQTAVDTKNLGLVHILLEAGARADVLSSAYEDRRTPLEAALETFEGKDSMMLVQLLLAAGADVNLTGFQGEYALYGNGNIRLDVVEKTMLSAAVHLGDVQLVKFLIEAGADVNAVSTCEDATERSPLQDAVGLTDLEMSIILLEAGADVRADSPSAYFDKYSSSLEGAGMLATAILNRNIKLFQLLLDSGANIDLTTQTGETITALQAASYEGYLDIVETLLRRGAEVDGNPNSVWGTALGFAVFKGHAGIVFALLEAGADPTLAHSDQNESPLVEAALCDHIDMVQMFLNAIKSRGTSGHDYVELLESSLKMALEYTEGKYNIAMDMIKTEIEDSKST
jgi:ankyrin repeat protein